MSVSESRNTVSSVVLPPSMPELLYGEIEGNPDGSASFGYLEDEPVVIFTQFDEDGDTQVVVPRSILVLAYIEGWAGSHTSDAVRAILE
jgi:hypothetical protein